MLDRRRCPQLGVSDARAHSLAPHHFLANLSLCLCPVLQTTLPRVRGEGDERSEWKSLPSVLDDALLADDSDFDFARVLQLGLNLLGDLSG